MDATAPTGAETPIIELQALRKSFGGVQAVRGVDLAIRPGEIHALVGENGAGKSTLGKMIAGVVEPTAGTLLLDGEPTRLHSPRVALDAGIAMMDQELAMLPACSVLDNVFLGSEVSRRGLLSRAHQRRRFAELSETTGFRLDPDVIVGSLSVAEQQKVEVLRAIARNARLIVMDEPTAPLAADEAEQLHRLIRSLRAGGTTIVFVSHFLEEVLALADRITVMRDGLVVRTAEAADETVDSLVNAMLGRSLELTFPAKPTVDLATPALLEARGLTAARRFMDVDLVLRPGEIVGLAGLVGSGRSELARALFGADPIDAGTITIDGRPVTLRSPRDAVRHGIGFVPESRKDDGLVMLRSVRENISLPTLARRSHAGFVSAHDEEAAVDDVIGRLGVHTAGREAAVATLSGGNQQKVLFGKWLLDRPRVLLVDEPTRGVDVGAKRAIYELMRELADGGMAMLVISSELEEVLGLADRVVVMHRGRVTAELDGAQATEEAVLHAAFGLEIEA
jgi:ABC-type sugar transport system ATPase subunit